MAIWVTADTAFVPCRYERSLLAEFVRGRLTIDEVLSQLATNPDKVGKAYSRRRNALRA